MRSATRIVLLVSLLSCFAAAADVKPFTSHSLESITQSREDQPFLLVLWSVECPPCLKELTLIRDLRAEYPTMNLVLIATDDRSAVSQVEGILSELELDNIESWIFSDSYVERLRFQIDPEWAGELPRSYFYSPGHHRSARSGALTEAQLRDWMGRNANGTTHSNRRTQRSP